MSNSTATRLTTLLSQTTPKLVYAIPLLIVSVLLTFAGTFLTLDRTRSFSPKRDKSDKFIYSSYESFEKRRKRGYFWWWRLEGGVGGLAIGYTFGAHLATLLALMVPSISISAPLSPNAFLSVYFISAILSSAVAGRYKVATILFASLSSGVLTSIALSVMLHPPLMGRRILLAALIILIAVPTTFIGVVSPYIVAAQNNAYLAYLPSLAHPLLRFCTASSGSFGIILSISLLLKHPAKPWADVWERLWVNDGAGWGTSQEKGFTAAWVFFAGLGILEDWALRKWLGDDPDEKWDDYLSSYVEALPYSSSRAGAFKPLPSLWERLLGRQTRADSSYQDVLKNSSSLMHIDPKLKPLLPDDMSSLQSPVPISAIPVPFYADAPPPPSHLIHLKSKYQSRPKALADANATLDPRRSDPLSEDGDIGHSDDSDEYDLPPFVRKRRKKGRFTKLRLRLYNPDHVTSHPRSSLGFQPLDKAPMHNDTRDNNNKRRETSVNEASATMSSETLVDNGSGSGNISSRASVIRTPHSGRSLAGRIVKPKADIQEASTAPEYSDHESDLTAMAPASHTPEQNQEQQRSQHDQVPRFLERHMLLSASQPINPTAPTGQIVNTLTGVTPTILDTSATDRARARVRALVSGVPVHLSRQENASPPVQISQEPVSTSSPRHGSPQSAALLPPLSFPSSVPATPSLLNAIHRLAVAQQQAYGLDAVSNGVDELPPRPGEADGANNLRQGDLPDGSNNTKKAVRRGLRSDLRNEGVNSNGGWGEFWKDVKAQARAPNW